MIVADTVRVCDVPCFIAWLCRVVQFVKRQTECGIICHLCTDGKIAGGIQCLYGLFHTLLLYSFLNNNRITFAVDCKGSQNLSSDVISHGTWYFIYDIYRVVTKRNNIAKGNPVFSFVMVLAFIFHRHVRNTGRMPMFQRFFIHVGEIQFYSKSILTIMTIRHITAFFP